MPEIDLAKLKRVELAGLLNSTALGTVVETGYQLDKLRQQLGLFRVGTRSDTHFVKFLAGLIEERRKPKPEKLKGYAAHKKVMAERMRDESAAGRDIAPLPEIVNPERKAGCRLNFRAFCETYFRETFNLAWSNDHLTVMARVETSVLHGGLFALAMPRGSGKTSLAETACLWALLYGHQSFVCLIGASEIHAVEMLSSMKSELQNNDRLNEDFPEVCYPIRSLEGIANRCNGQVFQGKRTQISWTSDVIVMASIPGSAASGAIVKVAGLTGRIRGMKHKRADGKAARPSLVIVDDPQTDESARSLSQCSTRERLLAGAVLGLAGPGKKIAGIMPLTVIRPGDVADNLLSREKHPDWNGERTKMIYQFPADEKLWDQYREALADSLREHGDLRDATAFYVANRAALDVGAVVAWAERFNPDEASALQHAINLRLQDEAAFFAEYQNEPLPEKRAEDFRLTVDDIATRVNGLERGTVPPNMDKITAFIDVQESVLYFVVAAWADDFTGWVLDYGTWPEQHRPHFTLATATETLAVAHPGTGVEGGIHAGLEALSKKILGGEWIREDGVSLRVRQCLIDANWAISTSVVYQFCRMSPYSAVLLPSHGRGLGASSIPMNQLKRKQGERIGHNWRMPPTQGTRAVRHVVMDVNFWKSFVNARLATAIGDRGALTLFGRNPEAHRMFAEHLTAEYGVETQGRGRTVIEWKLPPERPDNHYLDCMVGAAVAASILGSVLPGTEHVGDARKRVKLSDIKRNRDERERKQAQTA